MHKTRVISIANQKGGVGKTTTSVNIATALANLDLPTLLIDLDPQANATSSLGISDPVDISSYNVLTQKTPIDASVVPSIVEHLDLLPSHPSLAAAEVELVPEMAREYRLQQALEPVRQTGKYAFIILDCPPSLGLITVNAFTASDALIIPLQCEYFALEGLGRLLQTTELVKQQLNQNLAIDGILLTMFDARNNICHQVAEDVTAHFRWQVFETVIPRNVRLSEAPSYGKPIQLYDADCRGSKSYNELTVEYLNRLNHPHRPQLSGAA